jgi:hypothetical protein
MAKNKIIIEKTSQTSQYEIKLTEMKLLTSSLFNNNIDITPLTKSKFFNSSHKYRLFSYAKSNPKICWYINKYLNSKFIFGEKLSPSNWITTFKLLFKIYNLSKNTINYSKYKKNEFIEFAKLIKEYHEIIQTSIGDGDIISLYELYKKGIIHDDHINEIKSLLNIDKSKPKKTKIKQSKKNEDGIQIIFSNIEYVKQNRHKCTKCKLHNNSTIPLETNTNYAQNVDIALVGSFPYGTDDAQHKKLFLSDNLSYIKQELFKIISKHNLKYIITNAVTCYNHLVNPTKKQMTDIYESCSEMSSRLINDTFPATLKIILGQPANNLFNIRLNDDNKGKLINNIISQNLPKMKLTNKYKTEMQTMFQNIDNFFIKNQANKQSNVQQAKIEIDDNKVITRFTPNLTLFDIKQIKNQIVYILINEKGQKRYLIEEMQFPIYIKNGKYGDCDYIENQFDYVTYCNNFQRQDLNKLLHKKLESWKHPL